MSDTFESMTGFPPSESGYTDSLDPRWFILYPDRTPEARAERVGLLEGLDDVKTGPSRDLSSEAKREESPAEDGICVACRKNAAYLFNGELCGECWLLDSHREIMASHRAQAQALVSLAQDRRVMVIAGRATTWLRDVGESLEFAMFDPTTGSSVIHAILAIPRGYPDDDVSRVEKYRARQAKKHREPEVYTAEELSTLLNDTMTGRLMVSRYDLSAQVVRQALRFGNDAVPTWYDFDIGMWWGSARWMSDPLQKRLPNLLRMARSEKLWPGPGAYARAAWRCVEKFAAYPDVPRLGSGALGHS